MTKTVPSEVKLAGHRIQDIFKKYTSGVPRGFTLEEMRNVTDTLVVLDVFSDEAGYRRGFEQATRNLAERSQFLTPADAIAQTLFRATADDIRDALYDLVPDMREKIGMALVRGDEKSAAPGITGIISAASAETLADLLVRLAGSDLVTGALTDEQMNSVITDLTGGQVNFTPEGEDSNASQVFGVTRLSPLVVTGYNGEDDVFTGDVDHESEGGRDV